MVEDDIWISNSLKIYLENSDFEVDLLNTGKWAVKKIVDWEYDLIILDINLPGMDGIEICKKVREESEVAIIMLTARTWELDRITWLELWADDYIAKPFSPRELLARINWIMRRSVNGQWDGDVLVVNNIEINKEKRLVCVDWEEISLTKNEYDILLRIFQENGKVVSREILMTEVIWYDKYIYDRILDTHIKNLRRKIMDKDLILTIRWEWYRLNK